MKNDDQPEENHSPLTPIQRHEILYMWPQVTTEELDDAVQWSDWSVAEQIEEEGLDLEADTCAELDYGIRCMHVFFLKDRIQGTLEV